MSESLSTAGHGKRTKLDNARENARSVIWNEKFSRDLLYQAGLVKGWELCEERLAEVLAELLNREEE